MQVAFNVMQNERAMLGLNDVMSTIEWAFEGAQPGAGERLVSGAHWENEEIEREFALLPTADCPDQIVKWYNTVARNVGLLLPSSDSQQLVVVAPLSE